MSIKTNLEKIHQNIPNKVVLVAVSKTKPVASIQEAYEVGQRIFGENRVQEMVEKHDKLPKDIQWHLIGHLQKNKVKYIAPFVSLIHGVDSYSTLQEINKQALKNNRVIDCLLQVKIAKEESKFGLSTSETVELLNSEKIKTLSAIKIVGLMGMATFTKNKSQIKNEFQSLKKLFDKYSLDVLSMGMSGDYQIAINEGSTMVRVGSAIFGFRK